MSRRNLRKTLGNLRSQVEGVKVKARTFEPSNLPPMLEAIMFQPLAVVRQALYVTDPLLPMNQSEWLEAILAPTPCTYYGVQDEHLDARAFLVHLFGISHEKELIAPWVRDDAAVDRLRMEMSQRPGWLCENLGELRGWLLHREYRAAQHEDRIYNRHLGMGSEEAANLRIMIQLADQDQAPERLAWWAEHLTGGARLEPEEARAWLEAFGAALDAPQAHNHPQRPA